MTLQWGLHQLGHCPMSQGLFYVFTYINVSAGPWPGGSLMGAVARRVGFSRGADLSKVCRQESCCHL